MAYKIIHGFDGYTGLQLKEESSWGVETGTWRDVPFIGETLHGVWDFSPPTPEFGDIGAERTADAFNPRVEGELTFQARINGPWFNIFLAHLFGEEKIYHDHYIDSTAEANVNTHWYIPNQTGRSLSLRVLKSGPDDGGKIEVFSGLIISTARIEWAEGSYPQFTLGFVGKTNSLVDQSGTAPGVPLGTVVTSMRWLTNTGGGFLTGNSPAEINVSSFTINIDRQVTADKAFITDLTAQNQPGSTANRIITCDIQALLDQDFGDTGKPYEEFISRAAASARIDFRDDTEVASGKPYPLTFDFPNIRWISAAASIKEGGANMLEVSFKAIEGATTSRWLDTGKADMRAAVSVTNASLVNGGDADTHFADRVVKTTQA